MHARVGKLLRASVGALTAAVALVLISCGSDSSDRADTVETTARDVTDHEEDLAAGDDADIAVDEDGEGGSAVEDVEVLLLGLEDMPTGWTIESDDGDDSSSSSMAESCGIEGGWLPDEIEPLEKAERSFEKAQMGPFLMQSVFVFQQGDVERAIDSVKELVELCREFDYLDEDGDPVSGSFQPVSFPSFGDETFAARMSIDGAGFLVEGDVVAVRSGSVLMLVLGFGTTSVLGTAQFDGDEFEQIVRTGHDKATR